MDKQQATQHVLDRLNAGYMPDEVIRELSRLLNASPEIARRFVDHVIATQSEAAPPTPNPADEEDDRPDWMRSMASEAQPEHQPEPISNQPRSFAMNGDLPPGLQALMDEDSLYAVAPAVESAQGLRDLPKDDLPTQAQFVAPSAETENSEAENQTQKVDLEELAEYVLLQLSRKRRHNDIVEAVCNHTGWHWNKAQRFVARVKTKNHDKLQSGQNRVLIFIGIGIILIGLVIAINGIAGIVNYAKLAALAKTNPAVLLNVSPQAIIFSLAASITGIGMIIGGAYGIGRSLANQ